MPKYIPTEEAARILALDVKTVRNYGDRGILTPRRRGIARLEWDEHEVRDLLHLMNTGDHGEVRAMMRNPERLAAYREQREKGNTG